jgi:lipoprotein NlpI
MPALNTPTLQRIAMSDEAIVCKVCGLSAEDGYAMPLCPSCRKTLAARPFPKWIQAVTVALVPCLLVALIQFPSHLSAGIAYERGQKAESAGQYAVAAKDYDKAWGIFPSSDVIGARYGLALYHAGDYGNAVWAFKTLEGKKIPKETVEEVNAAIDDLSRKAAATHGKAGTPR